MLVLVLMLSGVPGREESTECDGVEVDDAVDLALMSIALVVDRDRDRDLLFDRGGLLRTGTGFRAGAVAIRLKMLVCVCVCCVL